VSPRLVLDASAAIRIVLGSPGSATFIDYLSRAELVLAPDIYVSEVANALWKYARHGALEQNEALSLLAQARRLVDIRIAGEELIEEALIAAVSAEHPVYDVLYAVLARRHGAAVLTADRRLAELLEAMAVQSVDFG